MLHNKKEQDGLVCTLTHPPILCVVPMYAEADPRGACEVVSSSQG